MFKRKRGCVAGFEGLDGVKGTVTSERTVDGKKYTFVGSPERPGNANIGGEGWCAANKGQDALNDNPDLETASRRCVTCLRDVITRRG